MRSIAVKAEVVDAGFTFSERHEITAVEYRPIQLVLTLKSLSAGKGITVTFSEVAGFRLLDEGDLLEFWPSCSGSKNWIFHVIEGGWFDQESQRPGFLRKDTKAIREFLITGEDACVSVFAWKSPQVDAWNF